MPAGDHEGPPNTEHGTLSSAFSAAVGKAVVRAGSYAEPALPDVLARLIPPQTVEESLLAAAPAGSVFSTIAAERQACLKMELFTIVEARYTISHFFIPFLEAMIEAAEKKIATLPESEAAGYILFRDVVIDNRDEEIGAASHPYADRPHSEGRKVLMTSMANMSEQDYDFWQSSLGDDLEDLENVPPAPRKVIEYLRNLTQTNVLAAAVAFLDYEKRIPKEYQRLLEGVAGAYDYNREETEEITRDTPITDPLHHLRSHIGHDDAHAAAVLKAIEAMVKTPEDLELVRQTIIDTQQIWREFWNTVDGYVQEQELTAALISPLVGQMLAREVKGQPPVAYLKTLEILQDANLASDPDLIREGKVTLTGTVAAIALNTVLGQKLHHAGQTHVIVERVREEEIAQRERYAETTATQE